MVNHTVVLAMNGGRVLLARHLEGTHIDALLPPSGKVRSVDQESIRATAAREAMEELGITVTSPRCAGVVEILKGDGHELRLFVIIANYHGHPRESNEMAEPHLYPCNKLPLEEMWPDADCWVPKAIAHDRRTPPFGLRLRCKRRPDGRFWFHVARFNPDALVRKFCA